MPGQVDIAAFVRTACGGKAVASLREDLRLACADVAPSAAQALTKARQLGSVARPRPAKPLRATCEP